MRSVMLAAVHYGELSMSPAQEVLQLLVDAKVVQEVIEVTEQSDVSLTPDVAELISWRRNQRVLEARWRVHLQKHSSLRDLVASLSQCVYEFRLRRDWCFRRSQWQTRQIEKYVTAKHILAWQRFSESAHSTLVVVESDAKATPDSVSRVSEALAALDTGRSTYVNLAGGLSRADISIEHLAFSEHHGTTSFARPVTNTSWAYAINRCIADALLEFLFRSPNSGNLGIDWLFNAFFMDQTLGGQVIECLHAKPPALQHGSLTGVTRSWHPNR